MTVDPGIAIPNEAEIRTYAKSLETLLEDRDYRIADLKEQIEHLDKCYTALVAAVQESLADLARGIIDAEEILPTIERLDR